MPVSDNLKSLRKNAGLTQKELAEKSGLPLRSIINYENGLREPNSKAMAALERFFGVSGEYLRGEEDKRSTWIDRHVFANRLTVLREERGLTQGELALQANLSVIRVNGFETAAADPSVTELVYLACFFGVSPAYLQGHGLERNSPDDWARFCSPAPAAPAPDISEDALKLAKNYDKLDEDFQSAVRLIVNRSIPQPIKKSVLYSVPTMKLDPVPLLEPEEKTILYVTSRFYTPMSAGLGVEAGDGLGEPCMLLKEPPRGTSYVAPISGDSMDPTFHDGDNLFIHASVDIGIGQIGVFLMDGKQWVKELGDGVLISHNKNYPPIPMTEDVRCQGIVLGVCDPDNFA